MQDHPGRIDDSPQGWNTPIMEKVFRPLCPDGFTGGNRCRPFPTDLLPSDRQNLTESFYYPPPGVNVEKRLERGRRQEHVQSREVPPGIGHGHRRRSIRLRFLQGNSPDWAGSTLRRATSPNPGGGTFPVSGCVAAVSGGTTAVSGRTVAVSGTKTLLLA